MTGPVAEPNANVLVVDDDAEMGGTIVDILALSGIAATAVTSASAAITFARGSHPTVVISDQRLPDMTGLDLCAAIRAIDPDLSLILLTGHASLDTAIAAVGQVDQYLTKPVAPDELLASVIAGTHRTQARRTERRETEQMATRLAAIVEGTDDAVISMTLDGVVTGWNRGAERLYGYAADDAIGQPASILVPEDHPDDLPEILVSIRDGRHVEHFETVRMRRDGSRLHVSLTVSPIHDPSGNVGGASSIARDITDRRAAEELRQELQSSAERHEQALRINDSVVQHLVVAQARLDSGDVDGGAAALDEGLERVRGLIDDLLPEHSSVARGGTAPAESQDARTPSATCSVVIADDSADIRQLVRMLLEMSEEFEVLAEAADGHEAIAAAASHKPNLVLLDHSMPNLDGLTALPTIREVSPESTVVMLSGFSADRLADTAIASGASAYLTKADLATDMVPALKRILNVGDHAKPEAC
jgi:PAS domain S-box-containing protein